MADVPLRAPNRAEQEEESEGFRKQKHIAGARSKRGDPFGVGTSPSAPRASKHSTAAGVTPNLSSRLWPSPDQMSEAEEMFAGREREMNDLRSEIDGAVRRGQALIDLKGRDV